MHPAEVHGPVCLAVHPWLEEGVVEANARTVGLLVLGPDNLWVRSLQAGRHMKSCAVLHERIEATKIERAGVSGTWRESVHARANWSPNGAGNG